LSEWTPDESGPILSEEEKREFISLSAWGTVREERQKLVDDKAWFPVPLGYVKEITAHLNRIQVFGNLVVYTEVNREKIRTELAKVAALAWRALEEDLGEAPWGT